MVEKITVGGGSTRRMRVSEWIQVEDNPIQRDTEAHAAKAKHLRTWHPTHGFVFAAQLPSGKLIKLDGHTRALLWKQGTIEQPLEVNVGIVPVKDKAEAEKLYKDFDSKEALETVRDKVSGAFNRYNFHPESPLLQYGHIVQALRVSYAVLLGASAKSAHAGAGTRDNGKDRRTPIQKKVMDADLYFMVNEFAPEMVALDAFMLRQGQVTSGVMAAFILSFRKYGHKIVPFWTGVFANQGSRLGGSMDGIQAVCEIIMAIKGRNFGGGKSTTRTSDICARCLTAVDKWLKGDELMTTPRPMDTTGYLAGHEKPQERLIKKADLERARA